jgi:hypothetical protein
MSKNFKKTLLLANILLLILVCFMAVKMVNGRASQIAGERMAGICKHLVVQMNSGEMTPRNAADYASQQSKVGNYVPEVNVTTSAAGVILETNDPSMMIDLFAKKEDAVARINCTELAAG